jgi:CheY-like chemotaxis protein
VPEGELEILLVEDDALDVMNVRRAFKQNKLTNPIHVAPNGLEALEVLRKGTLPTRHLVLLDLNMPKMNGIEFLRALRADPNLRTTSVVVLTTSNEDRDRIEAYKLNVARRRLAHGISTSVQYLFSVAIRSTKLGKVTGLSR